MCYLSPLGQVTHRTFIRLEATFIPLEATFIPLEATFILLETTFIGVYSFHGAMVPTTNPKL